MSLQYIHVWFYWTQLGKVYENRPIAVPLEGLRLGVLTSYINHTTDETSKQISSLFAQTLSKLSAEKIELVTVDDISFHPTNLARAEVALFEYEGFINSYLANPVHQGCPASLSEVDPSLVDEIGVGPTWKLSQLTHMTTSSEEYHIRLRRINDLKLSYAEMFAKNNLDTLIYPHQTVLVAPIGATFQPGRNGLLTSLTGTPGVVIPMGFSTASENAPRGVPVGLEVVGLWGTDWKTLDIAERIQRIVDARLEPVLGAKKSGVGSKWDTDSTSVLAG
jgi:Asp-tRNA(Asn)/Glu-tRNA(Gln) amidotransferase A subunit family amidase